ncbi:arylsulfatase A-like enzyme [Rhodopirellula rubra]|uniref:Arylsulfatase A-like enzyme n=1 Tax=Aporhodopirellula rubra TaxID=980271 RepID=A0A7W5DX39_9BACT|nr:sulfatase-like hydrolase/transferase [Aporhodopirellula rubra]MBB3206145.1 arylsulfatase A-like enzyme [Aporhodopirellula rubra]
MAAHSLLFRLFTLAIACMSMLSQNYIDAQTPNIVVIMADDLGWNSVGWHTSDVSTPNLDQLCRDGVEFDNFYVSPMCSPTRAGFMTGRYPIRFGLARAVIPPWRDYGLPITETTIANVLADAGYERRGIFGKWHLGHARKKWLPNNRGFTDFLGCYNGAIDYFTHEREGELDWHHNDHPAHQNGYATTLIGQAASQFIADSATQDVPFFCYIPFNAPHSPFQASDADLKRYPAIKDRKKRTYYAMISVMDDEVGRILQTIDDNGIRDDTVVWFFSDNGGVGGIRDSNRPLRGSKLTAYEGGVRAAACVRYPKQFPGGRKLTEQTMFIDVLPTVMNLAGADPQSLPNELDGVNLTALLSGDEDRLPPRDLFFYHGQQGESAEPIAVISGNWKLVVNGPRITGSITDSHRVELFHISTDPNETQNVTANHPEKVTELFEKLREFRSLQPTESIPPYKFGNQDFRAPPKWKIERD